MYGMCEESEWITTDRTAKESASGAYQKHSDTRMKASTIKRMQKDDIKPAYGSVPNQDGQSAVFVITKNTLTKQS